MSVLDDPRVLRRADDWWEVDGEWVIRNVAEVRQWRLSSLVTDRPSPGRMFDDLEDAVEVALSAPEQYGLVA